jgi:hypothetical protein
VGFEMEEAMSDPLSPPQGETLEDFIRLLELAMDRHMVMSADAKEWVSDIVQGLKRLAARPPARESYDETDLAQMFSDGVDVARTYGDNACHLYGEQLRRQFEIAKARMERGERNVRPLDAVPAREGEKTPNLHLRAFDVVQAWVQGVHTECEPCQECLATLHRDVKHAWPDEQAAPPTVSDGDRITAENILSLLAEDRPEGLHWPGVARLFRRLAGEVAAPSAPPREEMK